MARISSFVFCDQIKTEPGPNGPVRNIASPLSEIRPINIPGNYTFSIAFTISDYDATTENGLKAVIVSPIGKENTIFEGIFPPVPKDNYPEGNIPTIVNVDLDLRNVVFYEEGEHKVNLLLNNFLLTTQNLMVIKGE